MKARLIYLFLFSICIFKSEVNATPDTLWAPGQVIARLNSSAAAIAHVYLQTTDSLAKDSCLNILDGYLDNIGVWKLKMVHYFDPEADTVYLPEEAFNSFVVYYTDTLDSVMGVVNLLFENNYVDFVHPNWLFKPFATVPDDPKWSSGSDGQDTYMWDMMVPYAWDIQKGCTDIRVAVLDVGFRDLDHPDMVNKFSTIQFNTFNQTYDARGNDGFHGLHCASIIAANPDNNEGIAGIGWNTQIVSVKTSIDPNSTGSEFDNVIRGIDWVVQHNHAKVISMSIGISTNSLDTTKTDPINFPDMEQSLIQAYNSNIIIICAAGNIANGTLELCYPAKSDYAFSVGSVYHNNSNNSFIDRAGYSCFGDELDLVAFGTDIWLANRTDINKYKKDEGTSYSAPMVAAAAALILSQNPYLTTEQVRKALRIGAIKIPDMNNNNHVTEYGYGLLDVHHPLIMIPAIQNDLQFTNQNIYDMKIAHAQNSISAGSGFNVYNDAIVEFKAGGYIELLPGFSTAPSEINEMGVFSATIGIVGNACNGGGARLHNPMVEIPEDNSLMSESVFELYPNPCSDKFFIKFDKDHSEESKYTLEILNSVGQVVSQYSNFPSNSIEGIHIDLDDNIMPGVYYVRLYMESNIFFSKPLIVLSR